MRTRTDKILWAVALVVAGAAAWPLLAEAGLLNTRGGGDSPFLLQRVHQLTTAVADGHFPVRWMPDANFGYGYPFFNYYAPLAFYIAGAFHAFGLGLIRAVQLSQLSAFLVAGGGMFALGRRWFGSGWAALLVSVAYTLAPFHLVNVYVRGDSIAEFWAMAFYPLIFLAIEQIHTAVVTRQTTSWPGRLWAGVPLALAYAGLVLSHNISALIFSPFVLAYALLRWGQASRRKVKSEKLAVRRDVAPHLIHALLPFAVAGLLGLALSAWFWLPALGEQGLTQVGNTTADYFRYDNHFRTAENLTQTTLLFDFGVEDLQAFRLGLVQAILLVAAVGTALVALLRRRPTAISASNTLFLLLALLLTLLMMTPLSRPLWDTLPLLPFVQFPWRFLGLIAFFGAGVMGYLVSGFREWVSGGITAVLVIILGVSSLGQLQPDYLYLTDADVTAERLALYEWFTGNIGTTISAEYLPPTADPRAYSSAWVQSGERWRAWVLDGTADIAPPLVVRTGHQVWEIEVSSPTAEVVLPLLHWPGWQAKLGNGRELPLTAVDGSGLTRVTLPQGMNRLTLDLGRTPLRRTAETVSLAALLLVVGLWLGRPRPQAAKAPESRWGQPFWLALVAFLLTMAIFLGQIAQRPYPAGTLNMDFAQLGYLHHQPEGIPYGNGARLAGYTLFNDTAVPGDTATLTLDWSAVPPGEVRQVTVSLVTAATHFYNFVPPLTAVSQPLTRGEVTYRLPIPQNAPPGLYVPQITLSDNNRPRTLSGVPRGALMLAPLRIIAPTGSGTVGAPPPLLDVRAVEVAHRASDPRALDVQLAWYTAVDWAQHLKMSLRLTTLDGLVVSQFDNQPGYGQQATTLWQAGQWRDDWLALYLPPEEERAFPPPYVLLVQLYDDARGNGQPLLSRRLGELHPRDDGSGLLQFWPHEPVFALPDDLLPAEAYLGQPEQPAFALRGYRLAQTVEKLDITLFWEALQDGTTDYHHFVHLLDPTSGQPVAQHDTMPRNNSYPTSQWVTGEIVSDELQIDITDVPTGTYLLTAGLYEITPEGYPRLTAVRPDGTAWPQEAILLQEVVIGREGSQP